MVGPKRFLVVDDDESLTQAILFHFEELGIKGIAANDFHDAMFKIKNESFQFILTDLWIGQKESVEIVKTCKKEFSLNAQSKVFLMSGHLDMMTLKEIAPLLNGAFVKPFSMDDLVKKIDPESDFDK